MRDIERVIALEPELLITGHASRSVAPTRIRADLTKILDAVRHIHDARSEGMNAGKDLFTLMAEIYAAGRARPAARPRPGVVVRAGGLGGARRLVSPRVDDRAVPVAPRAIWPELAAARGRPGRRPPARPRTSRPGARCTRCTSSTSPSRPTRDIARRASAQAARCASSIAARAARPTMSWPGSRESWRAPAQDRDVSVSADLFALRGKVALITGANKGLGLGFATGWPSAAATS